MAFALQITRNHGLQKVALLRTRKATLLQIFAMSFPTLAACIVLADFGRSCSTDEVFFRNSHPYRHCGTKQSLRER